MGGRTEVKTKPVETRAGRGDRVRISDLAEALGLTKGTVSRALNDYPDISEATRRRVAGAAQRMGYRPLATAQAIRTGRVRAVGLVMQLEQHDSQRPFLADFLRGISTAAGSEGWTLTVATAQSEAEGLETFRRIVADRKADGFILPRTKVRDPRIDLLRDRRVPFVLYGRTGNPEGCAWFDILGEDAMSEAVIRLADHGHRRIAFLNGATRFNYSALRARGFRDGMAAAGLVADPDLMLSGVVSVDEGEAAARRLLALPEPPTAILCALDTAALGVYRAAAALGLDLGRDLSLIGYDGIPEAAAVTPTLTSFEVDQAEAGARLARLLIERCRGASAEDLRETAHARLRIGGTDGPPAQDSAGLAAKITQKRNETRGRQP
ncbi:substrate-binding domain-containing protein [Sulfitobacter sp. D35]|uniref:LacI family DNA-binding transcriptional regulator n=1 Tax=Sulfitobacter sp. D35 TaxID=3083252 RepID=UPI00296F6320|nr:substrate-binding domain-containing protein [Sulfitobacter sp. D35]MDW4497232.1 substrate-binding domain-containing protein [Sulfitobacter sp. D35]